MSRLNKHFIAGPWVGEFGWELFAWQAYVRSLSRFFEKTTVICRTNSSYLYEDFANDVIYCNPSGGRPDSFFMHGVNTDDLCRSVLHENKKPLNQKTVLFLPRRIGFPPATHYKEEMRFGNYVIKPEYISYGDLGDTKYDYVFHIRDRSLRKEDNWDIMKWNGLRDLLGEDKKIACIGTKNSAALVDGTTDMRDKPLKEVCDILKNTKCAFGPSSGPMHLASLCGSSHVVWSRPENKNRYESAWNPLSTKILFLGEHSWHPDPEYVFHKYDQWSKQV